MIHISLSAACSYLTHHHRPFPGIPMWAIVIEERTQFWWLCEKFVCFIFLHFSLRGLFVALDHRCAVTMVSIHRYCEMHKQPSRLSILSSRGCCEENSPFHYSMLHASTQTRSPLFIVSPLSFNKRIFIVTKTTSYRRHWKLSSFSLQQNVVRCGCLKRKREKIAHFEARKVKKIHSEKKRKNLQKESFFE